MPPRQLAVKDEGGSNQGSGSAAQDKSAKRKAVSSACVPCRRRKSKCDGTQPACSTCTAVYRTECSYDSDIELRRKTILRKSLPPLQSQQPSGDIILQSLRSLPESEAVGLLHNFRAQEDLNEVVDSITRRTSSSHGSTTSPLEGEIAGSTRSSISGWQRDLTTPLARRESRGPSSERPRVEQPAPSSSRISPDTTSCGWFRTPQDINVVNGLLGIYFALHHPFHPLFSAAHFMHDYQRGLTKYCSPALLHAVLSLACNYADRTDPHANSAQANLLGNIFFAEASSLANAPQEPCLTLVQALAVLGTREFSCGHETMAYLLVGRAMRTALAMGLHLVTTPGSDTGLTQLDIEVRKVTFWGVYCLEIMTCQSFGRVSQIPSSAIEVEKPSNADNLDSIIYQIYEDVNQATGPAAHDAMHSILLICLLSELCQIASDTNLKFYAPREHFTLASLQSAYAQFQAWYSKLPAAFHLQNTTMPQVVLLHMCYFKCLIYLFTPFMQLDLSQAGLDPHGCCRYGANEICNLMNRLRSTFGVNRLCLAIVGILWSAASVTLADMADPAASIQFMQAVHDLHSLSANHPTAMNFIVKLEALAKKRHITLHTNIFPPSLGASVEKHRPMPSMSMGSLVIRVKLSEELRDHAVPSSMPVQYRARFDSIPVGPSYTQYHNQPGTEHTQPGVWAMYPTQGVPMQASPYYMSEESAPHSLPAQFRQQQQ